MLGNEALNSFAEGGDPAAVAQRMIAEASATNPQLALLAQLFNRSPSPEIANDRSDEIEELTARLAEAQATIDALKHKGRRMMETHQACLDRLGELAAALGACGLCWGEDVACPSCRGRGRPGMVRPDMQLRARLLAPTASVERAPTLSTDY